MKILKNNISEAYKVQVDFLKDSESDSYDKNDMKEKVNDLVMLHEAKQKELKTAPYLEQLQILTLVPDKLKFTWNQKSRWNISKICSLKKEKLSWVKSFIW